MPYFVKPMMERDVCCSVYYVEVMLIVATLNCMRDQRLGIHKHDTIEGGYCFCDTCCPPGSYGADRCRAHLVYFTGMIHLWQSCVCTKEEMDLWHKQKCLIGECVHYGIQKKLSFRSSEVYEGSNDLVSWKRFECLQVGRDDEDKPRVQMWEVHKSTAPFELVQYVKLVLQKFIAHNFVAKWQDEHAKLAMKSLGAGVILSHIDFSENYRFEPQNKIQAEYYDSVNVTILVHTTHRIVVRSSNK